MAPKTTTLTFEVPESSADPVAISAKHSGLDMVLVRRESLDRLEDKWKRPGVYLLLGPPTLEGRFRAYVGEVGKGKLTARLRDHRGKKEWWDRALLVVGQADQFHSAEIGWLEGRLYAVMQEAEAADLDNHVQPGDETISKSEQAQLERYVSPIKAALRAIGASPDTQGVVRPAQPTAQRSTRDGTAQFSARRASARPSHQQLDLEGGGHQQTLRPVASSLDVPAAAATSRTRRTIAGSLADLIASGLLTPGEELISRPAATNVTATLLDDGAIRIGDSTYSAPSAAAIAAGPWSRANGWTFWGVRRDGQVVPLSKLRSQL